MIAAMVLACALLTQTTTTDVRALAADGQIKSWSLEWDLLGNLVFTCEGCMINSVNYKRLSTPVTFEVDPMFFQAHRLTDTDHIFCSMGASLTQRAVLESLFSSMSFGDTGAILALNVSFCPQNSLPGYDFIVFAFGAYLEFSLVPTSGTMADLQAVWDGTLEGISGYGSIDLSVSFNNPVAYPNLRSKPKLLQWPPL